MNVNSIIWSVTWLISVGFFVGAFLAWIWSSPLAFLATILLSVVMVILTVWGVSYYTKKEKR